MVTVETFEIGQLVTWTTGNFTNTGIFKFIDDDGYAHINMTFLGKKPHPKKVQVIATLLSKKQSE